MIKQKQTKIKDNGLFNKYNYTNIDIINFLILIYSDIPIDDV